MKYSTLLLSIVVFAILPLQTQAETVLRMGDKVSVTADQTVEGDFYASSGMFGHTTMSGIVKEDMYVLSASVTMNGTIEKDLTVLAGTAQIHGDVTDDVRIVAGDVTIAENVGGDVFVIGGTLTVLSNAVISGDVIFYGGVGEISGTVKGSILGTSEKMRVDAEVGKNIDIKTATTLTLGEKANIKGTVQYTSIDSLVRAQNAQIGGEVTQRKYTQDTQDIKQQLQAALIPFLITLFAALSLYLFFRKQLGQLVILTQKSTVKVSVIGFAAVLLGPIVSVLLMVTVLGSLLGSIILALSFLLYTIGFALSGCVFGSFLSKWTTNHALATPLWILLGTALLHMLLFVPVVGALLVLGLFIMTVGSLLLFSYSRL